MWNSWQNDVDSIPYVWLYYLEHAEEYFFSFCSYLPYCYVLCYPLSLAGTSSEFWTVSIKPCNHVWCYEYSWTLWKGTMDVNHPHIERESVIWFLFWGCKICAGAKTSTSSSHLFHSLLQIIRTVKRADREQSEDMLHYYIQNKLQQNWIIYTNKSPEITVLRKTKSLELRKLCSHPCLHTQRAKNYFKVISFAELPVSLRSNFGWFCKVWNEPAPWFCPLRCPQSGVGKPSTK